MNRNGIIDWWLDLPDVIGSALLIIFVMGIVALSGTAIYFIERLAWEIIR